MNNTEEMILFVSGDPHANDLDWKLPLILEYKRLRNYDPHVLFLHRSKKQGENFYISILEKNSIDVLYREDLFFLEPLPRAILDLLDNGEWKLIRAVARVYFSESQFLSKINFIRHLRKLYASRKMKAFIENYKVVFLCQFPNLFRDIRMNLFQIVGPSSQSTMIGIPDAAHADFFESKIRDYDLLLLNTDNEGRQFESISDIPYLVVGCQHYNYEWQKKLATYYETYKNNEYLLPPEKEICLVILSKPQQIRWEGLSHNEVVSDMLESLSGPDRYLLIKPHPRHKVQDLEKLLTEMGLKNYRVVLDSINVWASKADKVISLLSYGCLSPLANKKVPYLFWPITPACTEFVDDGGSLELINPFLRRNPSGKYESIFRKYTIEILQEKFEFPEIDEGVVKEKLSEFAEEFKVNRPPCDIIGDIDSFITGGHN